MIRYQCTNYYTTIHDCATTGQFNQYRAFLDNLAECLCVDRWQARGELSLDLRQVRFYNRDLNPALV